MATHSLTVQATFVDGADKLTFPGTTTVSYTQTNAGSGSPRGTATTTNAAIASLGTVNTANDYTLILWNKSTTLPIPLFDDTGSTSSRGFIPAAASTSALCPTILHVAGGTTIYTDMASGSAEYYGIAYNR
jgi:hypothetical protein